jgi:hypothetical protein
LGELLHCGNKSKKNKSYTNATMVAWGYQKLSRLDIRILKVINTKQDFEKKFTTHLG